MTDNPLSNIEDKKAQTDMGVMAIRTFLGALSEANTHYEAFLATAAFFTGMFKGNNNEPPEEKND